MAPLEIESADASERFSAEFARVPEEIVVGPE
jgi:hypothetical protein